MSGSSNTPGALRLRLRQHVARFFYCLKLNVMNALQVFSYNGSDVSMTRSENGTVYVNLTEVAKQFPNKNLTQIINSQEIKEYCIALSVLQNYSSVDLEIVSSGLF